MALIGCFYEDPIPWNEWRQCVDRGEHVLAAKPKTTIGIVPPLLTSGKPGNHRNPRHRVLNVSSFAMVSR